MELDYTAKGAKGANKKVILIVVAVLAVIAAIIAGILVSDHNRQVNDRIQTAVDDIYDWSGDSGFPVLEDDYMWRSGGRYDTSVKDNKKFARALCEKMRQTCSIKKDGEPQELSIETFSSDGLGRAYKMAAILEYLGYESPEVKACLDDLTAMGLEKVRSSSDWKTGAFFYRAVAPYKGLNYYTSRTDAVSDSDIEAFYAGRWQQVKAGMKGGGTDFEAFLEDVIDAVAAPPVKVPPEIKREGGAPSGSDANQAAGAAGNAAGNAAALATPSLDINNIIPYDELIGTLDRYGEKAIFRSGEGGYYDGQQGGCGDFRTQFISGKVHRTGEEDEFTENYLREHYDEPDKTYYYFRDEGVSRLPPFYTDTTGVYVYDGTAYAVTGYAVYIDRDVLVYDSDKAKENASHMSIDEEEYTRHIIDDILNERLKSAYGLTYHYTISDADNLVTVYVNAPAGTTAALLDGGGKRVPIRGNAYVLWDDLSDDLCALSGELRFEIGIRPWSISIIFVSDVDPKAGLLSILDESVVEDNSDHPPAPVQTAATDPEPSGTEPPNEE